MIRELKFWLFSVLLRAATNFLPKDAKESWKWIADMPIEK
jgi:hypothetical protein